MKHIALTTLALLTMLVPAMAHSPLETSVPADGDELAAVPETIDMTFAAPARVMKVEMIHTNGDASHMVTVNIPTRDEIETISLTPDFMGAGAYQVDWRALSEDGHVITGTFSFTVTGE
ncbi:MAG: copper resistance protein CopC [Silicimonas sp.]|uniref:copper resistance CopC family protein n=1 Tax=Roseitalea porphyridii TaxID=1852022 RepID=UPI0032ECD955